jgi:hypothetical protein
MQCVRSDGSSISKAKFGCVRYHTKDKYGNDWVLLAALASVDRVAVNKSNGKQFG